MSDFMPTNDDASESLFDLDEWSDEVATVQHDEGEATRGEDSDVASSEANGDAQGSDPMQAAMQTPIENDGALTLASYASQAYLEYAMSVVKSRALPDVSDGQKPVQRRILIDMDRMGIRHDARNVKSARVVGDVLGKYHPHGDQSVYDALVRMAQDFSMRYPLIAGEGNFGSRDGDSQAAMRYTETRLMPIAQLLLEEVDQGAVDFVANYDGNFTEPVTLPAKLPFVLLNGASGIAVGMATEIPSHNLKEVAQACTCLLENPDATLRDVMAVLPAPDFPCGAQIISPASEIEKIYATGRGKLRVRARYHFEELARGQWQLVIDELPPAASSRSILDTIEQITNPKVKKDKKVLSAKQQQAKAAMLAMLERVRDESGGGVPVRLVFEPKSSRIDRDEFVNFLLTQTELEANVAVNLVMLGNDGKPRQKTLLDILREWLSFRLETVRRRSQARLDKVLDRMHVLEGRQLVLLNIDRVIEIVRHSDEPKDELIREFQLSNRQADDILELRLKQLARLAGIAIEKELMTLDKERTGLERVLSSQGALKRLVAKEIEAASEQFGDARRTLVEEASVAMATQTVVEEPVTIVLSQKGYVRCRTGHGHDCTQMNFKMGDALQLALETRSTATVVIVDERGRTYSLPVSALPSARGDGVPLSSLLDVDRQVQVVSILDDRPGFEYILVTSEAMGLRCQYADLVTRLKGGRQFMKLPDAHRVVAVCAVVQNFDIETHNSHLRQLCCVANNGRMVVLNVDDIRVLSSGGKGVKLMNIGANEMVVAASAVGNEGCQFEATSERLKVKVKTFTMNLKDLKDYVAQRGRKGKVLKPADKRVVTSLTPKVGQLNVEHFVFLAASVQSEEEPLDDGLFAQDE